MSATVRDRLRQTQFLEGLTDSLVHRVIPNTPHTLYQELYHITFWQQISLDWIAGIETPFPTSPSDGFDADPNREPWDQLRHRFLLGAEQAAAAASSLENQTRDLVEAVGAFRVTETSA